MIIIIIFNLILLIASFSNIHAIPLLGISWLAPGTPINNSMHHPLGEEGFRLVVDYLDNVLISVDQLCHI